VWKIFKKKYFLANRHSRQFLKATTLSYAERQQFPYYESLQSWSKQQHYIWGIYFFTWIHLWLFLLTFLIFRDLLVSFSNPRLPMLERFLCWKIISNSKAS